MPRFRFRLTTLLVVVTAICLWLGVVVDRVHKQKRAVEVVERLGGVALFDYQFLDPNGALDGPIDLGRTSRAPVWARKWIGDEYFRDLVGLGADARGRPPTLDDLRAICAVRKLRLLFVKQPTLTDADLDVIANLSRLEVLNIGYSAVSDEGLQSLGTLQRLASLNLRQTQITDAGLAHLRSMISLTNLDLSRTATSGSGLAHLSEMRSLRELSLAETHIDETCLPHLRRLGQLRELDVWETALNLEAVKQLQASLPQCRIIWNR